MTGQISILTILCMFIALAGTIIIPVTLLIYFKKKGADILPFFIGCITFLLSALIIEQIFHSVILATPLGAVIQGNIIILALYGGLMAGLFEETGRFVAFKFFMKKFRSNDTNGLMYGAGHGGFEAIAIVGLTMINNIVWAVLINNGQTNLLTAGVPENMQAAVQEQIDSLIATSGGLFILSLVERVSAIALHIALSVLVWFAVKSTVKDTTVSADGQVVESETSKLTPQLYLYPLAIFFHALMDAAAVIMSRSGMNMILTEAAIAAVTLLAVFVAYRVWKRNSRQ